MQTRAGKGGAKRNFKSVELLYQQMTGVRSTGWIYTKRYDINGAREHLLPRGLYLSLVFGYGFRKMDLRSCLYAVVDFFFPALLFGVFWGSIAWFVFFAAIADSEKVSEWAICVCAVMLLYWLATMRTLACMWIVMQDRKLDVLPRCHSLRFDKPHKNGRAFFTLVKTHEWSEFLSRLR